MTDQNRKQTEETGTDLSPNTYDKPITTRNGRWRLGMVTLQGGGQPPVKILEIALMDPRTKAPQDVVQLTNQETREIRDLLVEEFGPPPGCLECPFEPQAQSTAPAPKTKQREQR